jgi:uncharacterized protein YukE
MGDLPNMAGIEAILDETSTEEQRILDRIEAASEELAEAEDALWGVASKDVSLERVKAWHEQALALANAAARYAAEIKALYDHLNAHGAA